MKTSPNRSIFTSRLASRPRAFAAPLFAAFMCLGGARLLVGRADAAPPGRYEIAADTVRDTKTGLTWQRRFMSSQLTWDEANAQCPVKYGASWRLPSVKELQTLVDFTKPSSLFDDQAFPWQGDDASAIVWSATPSRDATYAYLMSFAKGHTVIYEKTYHESVLCVQP